MEKFISQVKEGVEEEGKIFKVVEKFRLPEDFKVNERYSEGNYLKILMIKINS